MTPEQITLVRSTFAKVVPISETAAQLFYDRLFALDPTVQPLFTGDMKAQGVKLMRMIGTVVSKLTQLEELVPALQDLALRHVGYGVENRHYATVGEALLWTLEQGLGEDFNDEVKAAWTQAYALLSSTMIDAANSRVA
ncbi:hemin receptor [Exilibacterium tricleocarpae]|uniref:Hemin receptor n=1 Tax=Exilibacterium tricleocarpae TaxID=2591008 RepID=A0A545TLU4_9GAMM|nr:globin family protein [Exilibacterium tricleocarpae]TQV78121.1 hemin receptor [Exilibacterium tricleocarpae]